MAARDAAAMQRIIEAKEKRVAGAISTMQRHKAAEAKRAAARSIEIAQLKNKANKREAAEARRAELVGTIGKAQRARAAAVAAARAKSEAAAAARAQLLAKRVDAAASRRAAKLSTRVSAAKMSTLLRSAAVKLTTNADGTVGCVVLLPGEEALPAAEASSAVALAEVARAVKGADKQDEELQGQQDKPGVLRRLLGIFGL